ncbi:hypothetical protein QBC46DRAFT_12019 [Diplogelasinospora grovesii]|uniref:Ketoreductase domain-containing protein n=1 Tax=Diplogelasinospora grovesii TaxID=303347 RepID=A0AAN6N2S7_9PEZI|nr:hypothetical protein QBC46DRAFT_12019 [Diplogelasinospora grovesii]
MWSLIGKTCAITGAASGIGFAIAQRFAQEGAKVVLLGRNASRLEAALSRITNSSPSSPGTSSPDPSHVYISHDVRTPESWTTLTTSHPKINVLVNCAGITQESLLVKTSSQSISDILTTNLEGAVLGCKIIGKSMIRQKTPACIINVSSLLALKGGVGTSVYAASKAGLLGLTTSLANEYGRHGIRVNAILPGYIDTDMTNNLATDQRLIDKIPLQRFGTAAEVADAAAFLAKNPYANNCMVNLDGGLSAT